MIQENKPLEIWKDIPGYEGYYQVSNYGRVKSLERYILGGNFSRPGTSKKLLKERVLKNSINKKGYFRVCLSLNRKQSVKMIHVLVAEAFLNHKTNGTVEKVVDHIDDNKLNNHISNLQIITNRENCTRSRVKRFGSKRGVCFRPKSNSWQAMIQINGKNTYLGTFKTEKEASEVYEKKLIEILK